MAFEERKGKKVENANNSVEEHLLLIEKIMLPIREDKEKLRPLALHVLKGKVSEWQKTEEVILEKASAKELRALILAVELAKAEPLPSAQLGGEVLNSLLADRAVVEKLNYLDNVLKASIEGFPLTKRREGDGQEETEEKGNERGRIPIERVRKEILRTKRLLDEYMERQKSKLEKR